MRDRVGHTPALLLVAALLHLHGDELGRALAVPHDRLSKAMRHFQNRLAQDGGVTAPGGARRDQDEGVVRRGIAVDADAVEGIRRGVDDEALERYLRYGGVGCYEAEH